MKGELLSKSAGRCVAYDLHVSHGVLCQQMCSMEFSGPHPKPNKGFCQLSTGLLWGPFLYNTFIYLSIQSSIHSHG